jgi:filamentous hemagglutinin
MAAACRYDERRISMNWGYKKRLALQIGASLMAGLFFSETIILAAAPIMPDAKAEAHRHPQVMETASGIPLVNITAPTAGGVSMNDYERFNVPSKGAILNNSYLLSKTQTAGYVQGNNHMAKGMAKIIVNQVNGPMPTSMEGPLEVAGQKADVIIANSNGITVNGGSFIHTGRAVLTTGNVDLDGRGNLDGIRVDGTGRVDIEGRGLDAKDADALFIYTRAARINAGIWAKKLTIVTGANTIREETLKPLDGQGEKTDMALDVSAIGGMYAGQIYLVGTEKGLGFNMDGVTSADDLVLEANGHLYHKGTMEAGQKGQIHAASMDNSGTMAGGILQMDIRGHITNTGLLGAVAEMHIHGESLTNDKAAIASEGSLSIDTTGKLSETSSLSNREGRILSNGTMDIRSHILDNTKGTLSAGKSLSVRGKTLQNKEGKITAYGHMALTEDGSLYNREGSMEAHENADIKAGQVENTKGRMTSGESLTVSTPDIQLDGILAAGKDLTIHTEADLTNEQAEEGYGTAKAGGNLFISASSLTNGKKIEAGEKLILKAETIENKAEGEMNGKAADFSAENMTNRGLVSADSGLSLQASSLKNLETGRIYGEQISIRADTLENRKDKDLEEKLASAMKRLKDKEKALDEAFAVDVTGFTKDSEKEAYFQTITGKQEDYDNAQKDVDAILSAMKDRKSASIAARGNMDIEGKTLLNSAGALLYSGGNMDISEKESVTNRGANMEGRGNLTISAPYMVNENEAFSAKRDWTSHVTNPKLIRIDQNGHPERGKAFPESEFSHLSSGYGAYHNQGITPKEPLEEAGYGMITEPTAEEIADGEEPVDPALVGTSAPNYDYDDPIYKKFGITSMDSARPKNGDPAQAAWDEAYKKILDELNGKIRAYNEEVEAYNRSIGAIEGKKIQNYTIIRTNTHTSEKKVTETRAASMTSGGSMTLTGDVVNEDSRMTAGKEMTIHGSLSNREEKNQEAKVTFGTTQESYTKKKHWPHKAHRRHYRSEIFMTPQKELGNETSLGVAGTGDHTGNTPASRDITEAARDNVSDFLNPFHSEEEKTPGNALGNQGSTVPFLPESSLYKLHPESTAPILVETDPAFTNKHRFLSSDYMYRQMTWDPQRVTKRLGDGFYEQQLVRDQIVNLTGRNRLDGYDNEEEYKALMDNGLAYAKEFHLTPGVSLTKEQMAALTSDMVWLENTAVTVGGRTYTVLYPRVYLKPSSFRLTADGSLVSGNTLTVDTEKDMENQGTLLGNTIIMKGKDLVNLGDILGKDIRLRADNDIHENGYIQGEDRVFLNAGKNISMENAVLYGKNQDILGRTAGMAVNGDHGVLLLDAGENIHLTGSTLQALGDRGSLILHAGKDITLDTDTLSARKDMTENRDNYIRTYRKTEMGNTLMAGKDMTLSAGGNLSARSSILASENGKVTLAAGDDVTLSNGYNEARDDYGLKYKEKGFFSGKITAIKSHDEEKKASPAILSGDSVSILSGKDTGISASQIIASHDVTAAAGGNIHISSAPEYESHDYEKQVKKRGLLSGGGLGFTVGSEKRKDRYDSTGLTHKGSTVGSAKGNVSLTSGKDMTLEASTLASGKDLTLIGKNVTITSKDNEYTNKEEHEYKRSGLSVFLGGSFVSGVNSVIQPLQKSGEVQDGRLKNLYLADAGMNGRTAIRNFDSAGKVKAGLAVDVGFSSVSSTSKASSYETQAQSSTLTAKEKADIRSGENLSIHGSTIQGKDVDLEAGKDIRLTAAENKSEMDIHEKTKNGGISTSWGIGGLSGVKVYGQSSKGMENAASLTHTASEVSAENTLHVSGGNDTIMTGSRMEGGKVVLATGGSLRIESLQDTESYKSRSNVKGGALASDVFKDSAGHKKLDKPYLSAETARGYTDSDYASVKEQAGIYAGQEGYDISVKDNTHLKGAVIDSKGSVDKNTLRTGTLSWEDIENKADYTSGGSGISYTAKLGGNVNNDTPSSRENSRYDKEPGTNTHNESDKVIGTFDGNRIPLNERGLLGVPSAATKGKADSTTRAAIAPGKIVITDTKNQKQDVTGLDRNTRDSLNKLKVIFDKTRAEERKQLVEEMSIVGNEAIHELAARNGWGEGSIEKTALHGLLGAMTSKAAGSSALAGILSGGVQEYAMGYLHNHMPKGWAANHPDEAQMIAAGLGMIVGSISNDKKIGGYIAQMGAKWNDENKIREIVQEKLSKSSNNETYSGGEDTGGIPAFLLNLGVEVNADKYPWAYKFFKDGYMGSGREVDYSSDSEFAGALGKR